MRNLPESSARALNSVIRIIDRLNAVSHGKGEYAPHGALLCRRRAMGSNDLLPYAPSTPQGKPPSRIRLTRGLTTAPSAARRPAPSASGAGSRSDQLRSSGRPSSAPTRTAPRRSAPGGDGGRRGAGGSDGRRRGARRAAPRAARAAAAGLGAGWPGALRGRASPPADGAPGARARPSADSPPAPAPPCPCLPSPRPAVPTRSRRRRPPPSRRPAPPGPRRSAEREGGRPPFVVAHAHAARGGARPPVTVDGESAGGGRRPVTDNWRTGAPPGAWNGLADRERDGARGGE